MGIDSFHSYGCGGEIFVATTILRDCEFLPVPDRWRVDDSGILLGAALTLAMNSAVVRWIDTDSRDPMLLPVGIVALTLVSAAACYLPARRAAQVDPIIALRNE